MKFYIKLAFFLLFSQSLFANTWHVGPTQTYTKPSQVATLAQNGDTVLIDAGVYPNDVARWPASNLLIKGVGGFAHLKSGGNVYGGKAIWVLVGNNLVVENIEFSEAACPDQNGAGIRSEGINLVLRHCYFHNNENGILAGDIASGDFVIEYCEFSANGYGDGQSHNLYINHAHSLIFQYNYSHDAKVGHELKSRALTNVIFCNRFSDENGTASRSLDLPNGGLCYVVGNLIVQDPFSENSNLIGYGLEGLNNPNSALYITYNTLINNKSVGSFIHVPSTLPLLKVYNNILAGPGTPFVGTPVTLDTMRNLMATISAFNFTNPSAYDFHIPAGSLAAGAAVDPGLAGSYILSPASEYKHPLDYVVRHTTNDVGAFGTPFQSGVSQPDKQPIITVFPNPATDMLQIQGVENASLIQVFDLSGKLILSQDYATRVDISNLQPGIYFLSVGTQQSAAVTLFSKQ